jgi:hypothetical protein
MYASDDPASPDYHTVKVGPALSATYSTHILQQIILVISVGPGHEHLSVWGPIADCGGHTERPTADA